MWSSSLQALEHERPRFIHKLPGQWLYKALNYGLNESSAFICGIIRENSQARKRETTQHRLNQSIKTKHDNT